MNLFTDRKYLHDRHRLSHQQIDRLLGESFAKNYLQEKIKAMELVRQLIGLADLLNEHNIPFISFKGPLLSQQIYGDPTVRISHDLDVLVAVEDVDRIHTILLNNGYELGPGIAWPKDDRRKKYYAAINHHISFIGKISGILVEIHWVLITDSPVSQKEMSRIISENIEQVDLGGRKFCVFSLELNLAYLTIHGAKHGWQRLKWLVDIKDYPYELVDRATFLRLVEELNIKRIVSQVAYLLDYYWGISISLFETNLNIPQVLRSAVIQKISAPVEEDNWKEALKEYTYRLRLFKGLGYKTRILNNVMVGGIDLNRKNFPFKFMYVIYRPYSFIKRHLIHAE